jgi:hypothetical protein
MENPKPCPSCRFRKRCLKEVRDTWAIRCRRIPYHLVDEMITSYNEELARETIKKTVRLKILAGYWIFCIDTFVRHCIAKMRKALWHPLERVLETVYVRVIYRLIQRGFITKQRKQGSRYIQRRLYLFLKFLTLAVKRLI